MQFTPSKSPHRLNKDTLEFKTPIQQDVTAIHPRMIAALEQFLQTASLYDTLFIDVGRAQDQGLIHYLAWVLKQSRFSEIATHIDLDCREDLEKRCAYQSMLKRKFSYDSLISPTPALFSSLSECEYEWIGHIYEELEGPFLRFGHLHLAHGGLLLLPLRILSKQPNIAKALFQILCSGYERWGTLMELHARKGLPSLYFPKMPLSLKVILIGNHHDIETFKEDNPYWGKSLYALLEPSLFVDHEGKKDLWIRHLFHYHQDLYPNLAPFSKDVSEYLIWEGMRACGSQQHLPSNAAGLTSLNRAIKAAAEGGVSAPDQQFFLSQRALQKAFRVHEFTRDFWKKEMQREFVEGALKLNFSGLKVGQIHGLAFSNEPLRAPLALPFRLSCIKYLSSSEGELNDIDAKFGLGGNTYQKGNAIFYAYLRSFFKMPAHFPMAFSFVAEQTYDSFDGDSGTVAGFCCLLSSLIEWPLRQDCAVTGSMDQFGKIQAIGKVSEKIEGFFELIAQTVAFKEKKNCFKVLFPQENQHDIVLPAKIYQAIQQGQFELCPIAQIKDAMVLFFDRPYEEIKTRIEEVLIKEKRESDFKEEEKELRWVERFFNFFIRKKRSIF